MRYLFQFIKETWSLLVFLKALIAKLDLKQSEFGHFSYEWYDKVIREMMRKRENGFTTPYEMIFLLFFIFWMNESNIIKKGRNTKKFKHNNNKQQ